MSSSSSSSSLQHTLYLQPIYNFPRRLTYYLILTGAISNPKDLLTSSATNIPNLQIKIVRNNPDTQKIEIEPLDPHDAFPEGKRHPCMKIEDTATKQTRYIHESRSILEYFEAVLPGPKLNGGDDEVVKAINLDLVSLVDESIAHMPYYARHAHKTASNLFFGFPDSARNEFSGRNAKGGMIKALVRLQTWARENGCLTAERPWLSVGGSSGGPGLPDVCLIAYWRYVWGAYEWDVLEAEELEGLRGMRERFVGLEWWEDAEDEEKGLAHMRGAMRWGKEEWIY